MTHRYTVGGVAFTTDTTLADLESGEFADADLRVRFVDDMEEVSIARPEALVVTGPMDTIGLIDPRVLECWLPASSGSPSGRAWQLRQMAPIFSAVLGRLVLHASAIESDGTVIGFIGESGAGKSTLTRYLTDRGHAHVADDLLPIRFVPAATCPVADRMAPLGTLCFLGRTSRDTVRLDRISRVEAMQRLVANGFGEHGNERVWAFQFDAYHRLAEEVPIFDLAIPDDLNALPQVEEALHSLHTVRNTTEGPDATR